MQIGSRNTSFACMILSFLFFFSFEHLLGLRSGCCIESSWFSTTGQHWPPGDISSVWERVNFFSVEELYLSAEELYPSAWSTDGSLKVWTHTSNGFSSSRLPSLLPPKENQVSTEYVAHKPSFSSNKILNNSVCVCAWVCVCIYQLIRQWEFN